MKCIITRPVNDDLLSDPQNPIRIKVSFIINKIYYARSLVKKGGPPDSLSQLPLTAITPPQATPKDNMWDRLMRPTLMLYLLQSKPFS